VIGLVTVTPGNARLIPEWPYAKLMDESDVVVIAVPLQSEYTGLKTTEDVSGGATLHVVNTKFEIRESLKGKANRTIVVKHYELVLKGLDIVEDPPNTIAFVKRKRKNETGVVLSESRKQEYLLFLKRTKDESLDFVTGLMDPQLSVRALSVPRSE